MKRAVGEHLPDRFDQRRVGHRPLRPRPAPWRGWRLRCAAAAVDPRPSDAPDAADPGDTVAAARRDRDDGAHRLRGPHAACCVGWASTSAPQKGRHHRPPAARSWRGAARCPWSTRRPWSAAGRSSRPDRPAPATSGSPPRHRERRRASRSDPQPSPPTRAPRSPAARPAGPAAPRPVCDLPSCAAPGPEPRPLRYLRSPRPRLRRAQRHPSRHLRRLR